MFKVYLYHVKSLINSLLVIKYEMDSCQDDRVYIYICTSCYKHMSIHVKQCSSNTRIPEHHNLANSIINYLPSNEILNACRDTNAYIGIGYM